MFRYFHRTPYGFYTVPLQEKKRGLICPLSSCYHISLYEIVQHTL
nr:MAG TPA: hypothetical protein [Caudoviricetes sp.]